MFDEILIINKSIKEIHNWLYQLREQKRYTIENKKQEQKLLADIVSLKIYLQKKKKLLMHSLHSYRKFYVCINVILLFILMLIQIW